MSSDTSDAIRGDGEGFWSGLVCRLWAAFEHLQEVAAGIFGLSDTMVPNNCEAFVPQTNPRDEARIRFAYVTGDAVKTMNANRRRRRFRRVLVTACLLLIVAAVAGLPVYVRPQIDPLRHADAIFILGGRDHQRYSLGFELGAQGWAPNVVVSNPNGTNDRWLTDLCAAPHQRFDLHCFVPDPSTTKGEGRELRRLASQHGWRTVIVVTLRAHISRARFILKRCFDGELVMVASPVQISIPLWAFQYVYQTAGYARAVVQPGC